MQIVNNVIMRITFKDNYPESLVVFWLEESDDPPLLSPSFTISKGSIGSFGGLMSAKNYILNVAFYDKDSLVMNTVRYCCFSSVV